MPSSFAGSSRIARLHACEAQIPASVEIAEAPIVVFKAASVRKPLPPLRFRCDSLFW